MLISLLFRFDQGSRVDETPEMVVKTIYRCYLRRYIPGQCPVTWDYFRNRNQALALITNVGISDALGCLVELHCPVLSSTNPWMP